MSDHPTVGARIVHVLPSDQARGAQVYARELRDTLDGRPDRHLALVIFEGAEGSGGLRPDLALGVGAGWGRQAGFSPRAWFRLRRALADQDVDVVVAHGGESLKYVALAAPRKTPVVYVKIGGSTHILTRRLFRAPWRVLARRPAVVVAVSEEMAAEARDLLGVSPGSVSVVANARDPAVFRPNPARRAGRPHLLHVGSLTPAKRPAAFIALVARLRAGGDDVEASMVGEGPLLESLRQPAGSAGVNLLGRRSDVADLLRQGDLFVLTSAVEGMPGVLIEAAMSGLPAVTTAVSGASAVVEEGVSGFVVPIDDPQLLYEATRRLVRDPDLRRRMGEAARRHAVDHFGLAKSATHWQGLLDKVLGRPPAPPVPPSAGDWATGLAPS